MTDADKQYDEHDGMSFLSYKHIVYIIACRDNSVDVGFAIRASVFSQVCCVALEFPNC